MMNEQQLSQDRQREEKQRTLGTEIQTQQSAYDKLENERKGNITAKDGYLSKVRVAQSEIDLINSYETPTTAQQHRVIDLQQTVDANNGFADGITKRAPDLEHSIRMSERAVNTAKGQYEDFNNDATVPHFLREKLSGLKRAGMSFDEKNAYIKQLAPNDPQLGLKLFNELVPLA